MLSLEIKLHALPDTLTWKPYSLPRSPAPICISSRRIVHIVGDVNNVQNVISLFQHQGIQIRERKEKKTHFLFTIWGVMHSSFMQVVWDSLPNSKTIFIWQRWFYEAPVQLDIRVWIRLSSFLKSKDPLYGFQHIWISNTSGSLNIYTSIFRLKKYPENKVQSHEYITYINVNMYIHFYSILTDIR